MGGGRSCASSRWRLTPVPMTRKMTLHRLAATVVVAIAPALAAQDSRGLASADLAKLRGLGDVHISPSGGQVAYAVTRNDKPGHPYSEIWIRDLSTGAATRLGRDGNS